MSEMQAFLKAKFPLCVIRNPVGTWHFVGKVPSDLAYESSSPDYIEEALRFDPGLIRKKAEREGGFFRTRTWPTEEAAREAATALGFTVS